MKFCVYDYKLGFLIWVFWLWHPVGAFQFQFVFDGGAARDLHVHVREDAVSGRPGAENWVSGLTSHGFSNFVNLCVFIHCNLI